MPTEFVRVRDKATGHTMSVGADRAAQLADRGDVDILTDTDAVDGFGRPLPAEHATAEPATAEPATAEPATAEPAAESAKRTSVKAADAAVSEKPKGA